MKQNLAYTVIAALLSLTGCGGSSDDLRLTGSFDNLVTNCGDGEILNSFPVNPPKAESFLISGEIKAGNALTFFGDGEECGYEGTVNADGAVTAKLPATCLKEHISTDTLFISNIFDATTHISLIAVSDTLGHCSSDYSGTFLKQSGSLPQ